MNNSNGPITALEVLENDTDDWYNIPGRDYVVTDDGGHNKYKAILTRMRARLFTVTEAKKLGCIYNQQNLCSSFLSGHFWLSSASGSYYDALRINGRMLSDYIVNYAYYTGIRPVITLALNNREESLVTDIELEIDEVITIPKVSVGVKTTITPNNANNKTLK